jgi:hypothetical protein
MGSFPLFQSETELIGIDSEIPCSSLLHCPGLAKWRGPVRMESPHDLSNSTFETSNGQRDGGRGCQASRSMKTLWRSPQPHMDLAGKKSSGGCRWTDYLCSNPVKLVSFGEKAYTMTIIASTL